ncbi:MAG: hypothetical protein QM757_32155 [Paludibaculum sp.]
MRAVVFEGGVAFGRQMHFGHAVDKEVLVDVGGLVLFVDGGTNFEVVGVALAKGGDLGGFGAGEDVVLFDLGVAGEEVDVGDGAIDWFGSQHRKVLIPIVLVMDQGFRRMRSVTY